MLVIFLKKVFKYTARQKLSTTWLVSIISFLIMNLFQIGLLFSLPVHTCLLTCETGYWSIFIHVYMTGCVKCHVYFSTFVFANQSWFVLCRVLSFIFYWFGVVLNFCRSVYVFNHIQENKFQSCILPGCFIAHQLVPLCYRMLLALDSKQFTSVTFADISKTFDTVWITGILLSLTR
jgi:hypothetical protein